MAKGYKRDSRGRFNGGYGPGALGGKGSYAGRLTRGGSSGAKAARTSSSQRQNTRISAVGQRLKAGARRAGRAGVRVARNPSVQNVAVGLAVGAAIRGVGRSVDSSLTRQAGPRISKQSQKAKADSFRPATKGRAEAIGMGSNPAKSLRDMAASSGIRYAPPKGTTPNLSAGGFNNRPGQPVYGRAKGTKEYVGRRVTDGNYGFVMKAAKR